MLKRTRTTYQDYHNPQELKLPFKLNVLKENSQNISSQNDLKASRGEQEIVFLLYPFQFGDEKILKSRGSLCNA